jgi:hypothetical protein
VKIRLSSRSNLSTGSGPAAAALRAASDLSAIATRNGGLFANARVEAMIAGDREMPRAHGSRDMPVWGPICRALDPNDRLNRVRIANIVEYLASIQNQVGTSAGFSAPHGPRLGKSACRIERRAQASGIAIALLIR